MEQVNNWKVYTGVPHDLDNTTHIVYVIEYADRVKIGRTKHPAERIGTHKRNADLFGKVINRVAIKAVEPSRYCAAENELLRSFANKRIESTEEFIVPFEEVINSGARKETIQSISEMELLKEETKGFPKNLNLQRK